jgi:hypothetical protein
VSKERARRRAEREAAAAVAAARRARQVARRDRIRRLRRRLSIARIADSRGRSASMLGRRSWWQRAIVVLIAVGLFAAVWYFTDSWPTRIALMLLVLLALPVLVVVLFPRKVT